MTAPRDGEWLEPPAGLRREIAERDARVDREQRARARSKHTRRHAKPKRLAKWRRAARAYTVPTWRTRDGTLMLVSEMSDTHLLNTIHLLQRAHERRTLHMLSTFARFTDDEGRDWDPFDHHDDRDDPAQSFPIFTHLYREAEQRGLDIAYSSLSIYRS